MNSLKVLTVFLLATAMVRAELSVKGIRKLTTLPGIKYGGDLSLVSTEDLRWDGEIGQQVCVVFYFFQYHDNA